MSRPRPAEIRAVSLFGKLPSVPPKRTVDILVVCTGNICRSALAEKLFARNPDLRVDSAGTHAVVGAGMDRIPAELAERWGAIPAHEAKQLLASQVERASLILTMTREHRAAVLREHAAAQQRTFTLAEFDRQLRFRAPLMVAPIDDLVQQASIGRVDTSADDIEDPFRRGREVHERVGQQILELVDTTLARIRQ